MPPLATKRLQLNPFQKEDLDLFHHINTNPFVRQFLWDDTVISRNTSQEILEINQTQFEQSQCGLWKISIKDSSTIIGYTGLWYFFDEPQPQLIYALLPDHSQQGFATEAAQAIIDYAFKELHYTYLIAATDEPHLASQKVAQRLSMPFVEKKMEDGKPTLFYRIDNQLK